MKSPCIHNSQESIVLLEDCSDFRETSYGHIMANGHNDSRSYFSFHRQNLLTVMDGEPGELLHD